MPKPHRKYKLLLDEGCPPCNQLPRLNSRHNLKHILNDYKKLLRKKERPMKDPEIYELACSEKRLVVAFNRKHFRKLAQKSSKSGIIGLSQKMKNDDIDKKLLALLTKKTEKELFRHYHSITNRTNDGE